MKKIVLMAIGLLLSISSAGAQELRGIEVADLITKSVKVVSTRVEKPEKYVNDTGADIYYVTVEFTLSLSDSCMDYLALQDEYDVDPSGGRRATDRYTILEFDRVLTYFPGGGCMTMISEKTVQVELPNPIVVAYGENTFTLNGVEYSLKYDGQNASVVAIRE